MVQLRRLVPWLLVGVILGFVACEPILPERFYLEDFESLCDGAPCGWERSGGSASDVEYVSTIHPGIHGLRLNGTVSARGPAGTAYILEDELRATVTATCDSSATLDVTVVVSSDLGGLYTYSTPIFFDPERTGFQRIDASLRFDGLLGQTLEVGAVILEKRGGGSCTVDQIVIDDGSPCDGGCC